MLGWTPLATERITAILNELQAPDDMNGGRLFGTWIPTVPASDGEILLHISNEVIAADIIQVDQAAVVRAAPPMRTSQAVIPKLKHGHMISEEMIVLLNRIGQNISTARDRNVFDNYVAGRLQLLLDGIRDRRELLFGQMLIDDGDYNRFGITLSNLSWGMPSALKNNAAFVWSDTANATPLADIEAAVQEAEDDYGEEWDTAVMTRAAAAEMVATDEFADRSAAWIQMMLAGGTLPAGTEAAGGRGELQTRAEQILSRSLSRPFRIVVYNKRTKIEAGDGSRSTAAFLPDDKVVLLNSADFGNSSAWDFGNAEVIETMPGKVPSIIGGFEGGSQEGPVAYATAADPQGNPPGEVLWACQRGFPRKHRESVNGVLTI